jgi:type IV pilus assembly protein PilY1
MHTNFITKPLCTLLSLSVLLSPMGNVAYAATIIALPDAPLAISSKVKPNVLFTLDNSGSMEWASVTGKDGKGEYTGGSYNTRAFYSNSYNLIYYDPAVTYAPAVSWQNASLGNASLTSTRVDPFLASNTTTINVSQTCSGATNLVTTTIPSGTCSTGTTRARYAYYYNWNGVAGTLDTAAPNNANFTSRVDIIPGRNYPRATTRTDCITVPTLALPTQCSYQEEIQNFANWYSYYRTRILMTKTALGQVFGAIDFNTSATNPPQFRIGFQTINDASGANDSKTNDAYWLDIADFDATQKQTFFNTLYAINPNGSTTLRIASDRAGKLYSGTLGAKDPVQYSCQQNYHILSTDGFWNDAFSLPVAGDNLDAAATITLPELIPPNTSKTINTDRPIMDANSSKNSLADVAYYYWATDLRPSTGTCTIAGNDVCKNNVRTNTDDKASWQHMTTYTVGLGANGTLNYQNSVDANGNYKVTPQGTYASLLSGAVKWPSVPTGGDVEATIDDLWHAAVNGHGTYFNAGDPVSLRRGLTNALMDIGSKNDAGAGFTLNTPGAITDTSGTYIVKFDSGTWSGNLQAQQIGLDTSGGLVFTPLWDARERITAQASGAGWDTNRKIVTSNGSSKIPFRLANLGATQKANLGVTADQQDMVDYLRGKPIPRFRSRTYLLGDIVGSEAVVVKEPKEPYLEAGNEGYGQFKNANLSRKSRIYVGANDGMLHAIDPTLSLADSATAGQELWAYVPSMLFAGPNNTPAIDGLAALANSTLFKHHFYVDQTPVTRDVDFARTNGATGITNATSDWRTILVGGLNKGGKGFYALDITNPDAAATEAATATTKVLWEFTDPDMGFSFGQPQIAKTRKHGWVVFLSSGYNNTGNGYLYVVDVKTGALLEKISTGVDAGGGMSEVTGWVPSAGDYTAEQVYAGDMNGNVWRFDASQPASSTAAFPSPVKMATLTDGSKAQPITTAPRIDLVGSDRWVVVGTGKLLSVGDDLDKQQQTMYVFKDGNKVQPYVNPGDTSGAPILPNGLSFPLSLRGADMISVSDTELLTSNSARMNGKIGWFHNFTGADTTSGGTERVHVTPIVRSGLVAWTTGLPQGADPCTSNMSSRAYVAGITDAKSRVLSGSGLTKTTQPFLTIPEGDGVKMRVITTKDGKDKLLIQTTDGKIKVVDADLTPGQLGVSRLNWREIK